MTTRKLVDSCVLVYAYDNSEQAKHGIAKGLLSSLVQRQEAAVSVQNLAEFSRVMAEKSPAKIPAAQVSGYVSRIAQNYSVVGYGAKTVEAALLLCAGTKLHFFDALLAATMRESGIYEILTENDRDFSGVPGIKATNPFRRGR